MALLKVLAVAVAILVATGAARAAPVEPPGQSAAPWSSDAVLRARHAARLGGELERTLGALPGVARAHVHLSLPEEPLWPAREPPRATASVLLELGGEPPVLTDVQRLVAGAAPRLAPADVAVIVARLPAPSPAPPALVAWGPLYIAPASRPVAAAWTAVLLALLATMGGLLTWTARRAGRAG